MKAAGILLPGLSDYKFTLRAELEQQFNIEDCMHPPPLHSEEKSLYSFCPLTPMKDLKATFME